MKTGLPAGTAAKTGEGAPPADEHVLSSIVCRVLGQDTAGNERARPRPPGGRPRWGHARAAGRTTESSRGPTCAAGGAGAAEGAEAALRGASHGGLTARAPALQPRGSPGGAATRVLRGGPSVPSEEPGLTGRWSRRPFLSDAASARKPRLDRSLGLSKETPACFSLPGTKTQIVPAVPSAEGPGPPQSLEDPPRVRPGAPHTPATGASLGESGLDAAGTQTRQPEVLGQPASSLWADVAVSRNHGVSLRGTICTRKW